MWCCTWREKRVGDKSVVVVYVKGGGGRWSSVVVQYVGDGRRGVEIVEREVGWREDCCGVVCVGSGDRGSSDVVLYVREVGCGVQRGVD